MIGDDEPGEDLEGHPAEGWIPGEWPKEATMTHIEEKPVVPLYDLPALATTPDLQPDNE